MKVLIYRMMFALMLAVCGSVSAADAQETGRLTRPNASKPGADGKLVVAAEATFGNVAVDAYVSLGENLASGVDRKFVVATAQVSACRGPIGAMSGVPVGNLIKRMSKEQRAKLKARELASLTAMSVEVLADLDGVGADLIAADEAIGPGVYHTAIAGMNYALDLCGFFGMERSL